VTLAGLVLERLGHIPSPGQTALVPPYRLTVLAVEGRRIARVLVERTDPQPGSPSPE
jgi:putative hemolysin